MHDTTSLGGGYLGCVDLRDPVDLLATGELLRPVDGDPVDGDDMDPDRTRAAYDPTAHLYAEQVGVEIRPGMERPLQRRLLDGFAETVRGGPPGPVVDLGCRPGRVAAFLTRRGVDAFGLDISRRMLDLARTSHGLEGLLQAEVARLPLAWGSVAGAVCWNSIIHTPPESLTPVADELGPVLGPDGHVMLAFQAGTGNRVDRTLPTGQALTSYRHDPEQVAGRMRDAGFAVESLTCREAESAHEKTPQAFLICRRRRCSGGGISCSR